MRIAVDFDGTIVEHAYPKIGRPIEGAIESLLQLQSEGHQLILWTYRTGELLNDAVEYCRKNGIEFYAVNSDEPNEIWHPESNRLIRADVFIDDRNIGGLLPWSEVSAIIKTHQTS
jgi:hypothetical protein